MRGSEKVLFPSPHPLYVMVPSLPESLPGVAKPRVSILPSKPHEKKLSGRLFRVRRWKPSPSFH